MQHHDQASISNRITCLESVIASQTREITELKQTAERQEIRLKEIESMLQEKQPQTKAKDMSRDMKTRVSGKFTISNILLIFCRAREC